MNNHIKTNCYVFKYGFVYVGWIVVRKPEDVILYYDDRKTSTMTYEHDMPYMTIGFNNDRVLKRLIKYINRHMDKFSYTEESD